jgi:hypothetical protein
MAREARESSTILCKERQEHIGGAADGAGGAEE